MLEIRDREERKLTDGGGLHPRSPHTLLALREEEALEGRRERMPHDRPGYNDAGRHQPEPPAVVAGCHANGARQPGWVHGWRTARGGNAWKTMPELSGAKRHGGTPLEWASATGHR